MKGNKKAAISVLIIILSIGAIICSGCVSKSSDKENKGTTENNQDVQKVSFEAQYTRTNGGTSIEREYPIVTVIHSVEELSAYYETNKEIYDLRRREIWAADSTIGFLNVCDKYNEEYFKEQELVLILLRASSGSIEHKVSEVIVDSEMAQKKYTIVVDRVIPEAFTADSAEWHIFVELEKGIEIEDASQIELEIGEVEIASYEE